MLVETLFLTKRYGQFAALADCTLSVFPGEVFGLLGPNGAGKTTLLRTLMGFLRPTSGRATIDGLDCWSDSRRVHARVSYLPGETRLYRQMNGREVLRFFARTRNGGMLGRSLQLADRLGLDLSRGVAMMSTGMRQKLALAVALSVESPLLVLDEPTSNLDPTVRAEVGQLVREARRAGRTVLFSSHVLSEVETVCDRVAILRAGRLVHLQPMQDLRRKHRIRAQLQGALTPVPPALNGHVAIHPTNNGHVTIDTDGELAPLFGWLSNQQLTAVRIEPIGLESVYENFHPLGTEFVNG